MVRNGVPLRPIRDQVVRNSYTYDHEFFSSVNTEEKAYWLGFITADGCISDTGDSRFLSIRLQDRDHDHLVKFCRSLKSNRPVLRSPGVSYMSVSSRQIIDDLISLGVTPRKSLTAAPWSSASPELARHYIRGLFDGDGFLHREKRGGWAAGFGSGRRLLVEFFAAYGIIATGSTAKIRTAFTSAGNEFFDWRVNGVKVTGNLISWLYKDTSMYLDRKKSLADELIGSQEPD